MPLPEAKGALPGFPLAGALQYFGGQGPYERTTNSPAPRLGPRPSTPLGALVYLLTQQHIPEEYSGC